ncbi:hypothetical protein FA15DRAFT_80814 [Coprinopsis marcescibilis]|uniref:Uncharacterized protein n=1 Tax=Coprinopsis marcescibilis TaxID=230819 RepID=A0A5C3KMC5_COPMA|nr:hypothetical protein FA15DRAFT_80814 [Coprinopsis marcescibilis]
MDVFNPKILDASIRDISSCLSDSQKADLLLYAMKSMLPEGRTRTLIENATQSCLQVSTLTDDSRARARLLRAKTRIANGNLISAQEGERAVPFISLPFNFSPVLLRPIRYLPSIIHLPSASFLGATAPAPTITPCTTVCFSWMQELDSDLDEMAPIRGIQRITWLFGTIASSRPCPFPYSSAAHA